jgi:hypothetical protein
MIKKIILLLISFSFGFSQNIDDKVAAKFLVLDNASYQKAQDANLLNGGILKEYTINDVRLKKRDLKNFYPEYFLYNSELKCSEINKVVVRNNKKENITDSRSLKTTKETKEAIKKMRFLQIVSELGVKSDIKKLKKQFSNDMIKVIYSIGFVCKDELVLRGQTYNVGDHIDSYKITNIKHHDGFISFKKSN